MKQKIYFGIKKIKDILRKERINRALLVCDSSFEFISIKDFLLSLFNIHTIFNKFASNPLHDDVDKGTAIFLKEKCDGIIAVGGGSSLDVAKCIKLDSKLDIPIVAIPTTAGTGSESTKHIVVYKDGKKESLASDKVIPNYVLLEPKVLETLPIYQKECTMFDALCQGIESYWSINANCQSRKYSFKAIRLIIRNAHNYMFCNDLKTNKKIMIAANLSGKAINISQTTAAHAMSYKLTSKYGIPHGNAVAICLPKVWEKMVDVNRDKRLNKVFKRISYAMDCKNVNAAIHLFTNMLKDYKMKYPFSKGDRKSEIDELVQSVNPVRLKNNPIILEKNDLKEMYEEILR